MISTVSGRASTMTSPTSSARHLLISPCNSNAKFRANSLFSSSFSSSSLSQPNRRKYQTSARSDDVDVNTEEQPSPTLYTVTIKKPLGLVLAERKETGQIFVEEIVADGNAAKMNAPISVGDVLVSTSAIVLKSGNEGRYERQGHGNRVYDNFETVEFDCTSQDFNTVMAAISSNNERWGIKTVTLTFDKKIQ